MELVALVTLMLLAQYLFFLVLWLAPHVARLKLRRRQ